MNKQFTATAFIVDSEKVLLIYHRKLQKWLPPGGHMEENETPPEAARRETLEETGWHIDFILQENTWVERWNARSFERPYLCLLEEIPPYQGIPAHQHIDFIYVARPVQRDPTFTTQDQIKWFSLEELEKLKPDVELFEETLQVTKQILKFVHSQNNLCTTFNV